MSVKTIQALMRQLSATPPTKPMTLSGTLPSGTVGVAYSGSLTIGGTFVGPVTVSASVGSFPAWMTVTVTGSTIKFTGTPTSATTVTFTARAVDSTSPTPQSATSAQSVTTAAAGVLTAVSDVQTAGLTVFLRDLTVPTATGSAHIIANTQYDVGDGTPVITAAQPSFTSSNLRYAQHTYASAGTYSIIQTTTDASGNVATHTWTVTVAAYVPPAITGASGTATVVGILGNGKQVNVVANPGHRVPMVAGDIASGSMKFYSDQLCVSVENVYMGITDDLFGEFHVYVGSKLIFSGPLSLWAYARARPFWVDTPVPLASPDLSLFPNYGPGSESASWYSQYVAGDNSPMGRGNVLAAMGTGGEHDYLGPVPTWDACYLTNPTTQNATVVRGMGDSASVWSFHVVDFATQKMVDMRGNPKITALGALRGSSGNPIVKTHSFAPQSIDQTQDHAVNFSSLCCALYGTDYDREELALWANYVQSLWQNWAYRLPSGCVSSATIPRGIGRGLVVMSYASKLSSETAYFTGWMGDYAADLIVKYGSQTGIQTIHNGWGYPHYGQGPWQMALAIYGIGLSIKHGYTQDNYPGFQWALDYFMELVIDSLVPSRPGSRGIQHEFATNYTYAWAYDDGTPVPDWNAAINQMATHQPSLAAALLQPENSQALQNALGSPTSKPGDLEGYPTAPDGYPAMQQIALAVGADHCTDQAGARAAWNAFAHNDIGWGHARILYANNPKYNIVPEVDP